ncbi:MAG TPA: hypothetical protein VI168_00370 [Croceibacterium sp.]
MSRNARMFVFVLGALAVAGGTLMTMLTGGGGIGLLVIGTLLIASLALEGRYGRPGAPTQVPPHAWELTGERFIDEETGQLLEVWIDPLTGERRYEPAAAERQLRGPGS